MRTTALGETHHLSNLGKDIAAAAMVFYRVFHDDDKEKVETVVYFIWFSDIQGDDSCCFCEKCLRNTG